MVLLPMAMLTPHDVVYHIVFYESLQYGTSFIWILMVELSDSRVASIIKKTYQRPIWTPPIFFSGDDQTKT